MTRPEASSPGARPLHEDLLNVRRAWYAVDIAGHPAHLARYESADFVAIGAAGIEDRSVRISTLAAAVTAGRWMPPGSRAQDDRLDLVALADDVVAAYGVGRIVTPRGEAAPVVFTELWRRDPAGWRVVHLHYHAPHPAGAVGGRDRC